MADETGPPYQSVAVGLPVIDKNFGRTVFYLFPHGADQFHDPNQPNGTGFFVARHSEGRPFTTHVYAISNRHVVQQAPWIRVNKKDGDTRLLKLDFDDWIDSPVEDLAAADITDHLDLNLETLGWGDDVSWITEASFVRLPAKFGQLVGVGDDAFMMGLFEDHRGGKQNSPVGRFGNVAAVPDPSVPVALQPDDPFARPGYLNDMRSRSGFSGSPVWIWRAGADIEDIEFLSQKGDGRAYTKPTVAFLGVHRGQIQERVEAKKIGVNQRLVTMELSIPSAMTAVIPSWEVSALLDARRFRDQRSMRDARGDRIKLSEKLKDILRARKNIPAAYLRP